MSGPSGAIDADIDTYTHGKNVVEFTPQEEGRLLNPNMMNALCHHYHLDKFSFNFRQMRSRMMCLYGTGCNIG